MDNIGQLLKDAAYARRIAERVADDVARELIEIAEQLEWAAEEKTRVRG